MRETFIVSVQTEDGKWSIQQRITCDLSISSLVLSRFYHACGLALEDVTKFETGLGSGIGQFVSGS